VRWLFVALDDWVDWIIYNKCISGFSKAIRLARLDKKNNTTMRQITHATLVLLCYTSFILILLRKTNVLNNVSRFWRALSTEQRLSVGFFSILSIVMLTLGVIQIRRNIIYPFTSPVEQLFAMKNLFGQTDAEKEAQAKKTDSDGDGLNDWDEEYVYLTSQFLADTDSDGIADNVEIAKHTDPQCPSGENCGYIYSPPDTSGATSFASASSSAQTYGSALPLVPNRDATSIRSYLKAQGMSDTQLSAYSDAALLDSYDRSVTDFDSSSKASDASSVSTSTSVSTADSSSALSDGEVTTEDLLNMIEGQ
jgi:hypothetical protein